jgi:hypothetical protein
VSAKVPTPSCVPFDPGMPMSGQLQERRCVPRKQTRTKVLSPLLRGCNSQLNIDCAFACPLAASLL